MRSTQVVDSITKVKKKEWDRLAGDNVVVSHGWLRTLEETYVVDLKPRYFLSHEGERLVGATVGYFSRPTEEVQTLDDIMFGRLRKAVSRLGCSFLPALLCSPIRGQGNQLLVDRSLDRRECNLIMAELLDALEAIARSESLPLCFLSVPGEEVELRKLLKRRGYGEALAFPSFYLDVKWRSFDAYIADIRRVSKNMARNVTREINLNRRAGVRIERLDDIRAHSGRLYELADAHWFEYNRRRFPYTPAFFETVCEHLGDGATIYAAFKESVLIGFLLLLRKDERAYALEVGIDRDLGERNGTYFNLNYYTPLSDAIENGTKGIHFGCGARDVKLRRGCKKTDLYLYFRSGKGVKNLALQPFFAFYSMWVRRKWRSRLKDPTSRIWVDRSDRRDSGGP
jgi:predicted N-acyltransferase